ncbi:hypothetical protein [Streptomyces sp. NPDC046759]|uniref:hypothetical protein n=1 Tax=Streptomyces sp. NPDC046759 TaxID=3155019 RepID=UPI0033C70E35
MADWTPVLRSSYDSWLGVMPNGMLGVGKADEGRATLEGSGYVAMWPFLERDLVECLDDFTRSWHLLGGHGVSTPEKLVELTVQSACSRGRPYWMALAVQWLTQMAHMPGFDSQLVSGMLKSAAESETLPSELREQARRHCPSD